MTISIGNIFLAFLTLVTISCREAEKSSQKLDFTAAHLNNSSPSNRHHSNFSDPFLLGKKFRIIHESYGCVHYRVVSLDVEEKDENYFVTIKGDYVFKFDKPKELDVTFGADLINFIRFYQHVRDTQKTNPKQVEYTFETINRLTFHGGKGSTVLFCHSEDELKGFYALLNIIAFDQKN